MLHRAWGFPALITEHGSKSGLAVKSVHPRTKWLCHCFPVPPLACPWASSSTSPREPLRYLTSPRRGSSCPRCSPNARFMPYDVHHSGIKWHVVEDWESRRRRGTSLVPERHLQLWQELWAWRLRGAEVLPLEARRKSPAPADELHRRREVGMDGAPGTGRRDGEETSSSLLLEGQELQPARVCRAAACGWVWGGKMNQQRQTWARRWAGQSQSSALSRDSGVLLPYPGLSLAQWPACGMLWGRDVPAGAGTSRALGMGTGCRHPNPAQGGMSWRCEPSLERRLKPREAPAAPVYSFPLSSFAIPLLRVGERVC